MLTALCQAQKVFTAYDGVDVVNAGNPPTLYTATGLNNTATVYDTTFNTHIRFDGTTFSSYGNLMGSAVLSGDNITFSASNMLAIEWRKLTATTAGTGTLTVGSSQNCAAMIVTFKGQ